MKMKKYNLSLIKKGILFSLVLLSPEILAAERLGFNYTRPDALTLAPELGLQTRGCHAPTDPMNIRFIFRNVEMSNSDNTKGLRVKLTLKGISFPKGYAALTYAPSPIAANNAASDKDKADKNLLVPWSVTVQGTSKGTTGYYSTAEHPTQYENPFCFSRDVPDGIYEKRTESSLHLFPIYRDNAYNGKDNPFWKYLKSVTWDEYCKGKEPAPESHNAKYFYWPDYYTTPTDNPDEEGYTIWARIHGNGPNTGENYLTSHMFYGGKVTLPPDFGFSGKSYDDKFDPVTDSNLVYTYTFPAGAAPISRVKNSDFLVKLNNRAITSMTLTLFDGATKKESVFEWKRNLSGDYPLDNVLRYQGKSVRDLPVSPFPRNISNPQDENDPYNHFYLESTYKDYFRGTLVTDRNLTQDYRHYDRNIAPLPLLPEAQGNINLANTDSLAFRIEQKDLKGDYFVTVYGSPMIFGPLYTNKHTVAASAIQVRDACY
ncbi:hypothetical protein FQW43_27760 [Salmonella enterica subsp. enterica serovar Enteritidis]|nr:hypothetical protein [Salmonella enterica subsp. enterica serovar Enteritidis]